MEYSIRKPEFNRIRTLLHDNTGISLSPHKSALVVARLNRRLRHLGLKDFKQYLELFERPETRDSELLYLINALTTNTTNFFRESHHFDFLREQFDDLLRAVRDEGRNTLRVWSAACSTGQEPYTLAMVLREAALAHGGPRIRILATDIDTNALSRAKGGVYSREAVESVPPRFRKRAFRPVTDGDGKRAYQVTAELRNMVVFRRLNLLLDPLHFREPVDIVMVRNVLIYFDDAGRHQILSKLHSTMRRGGLIFVGHSESLLSERDIFAFRQNTIYTAL